MKKSLLTLSIFLILNHTYCQQQAPAFLTDYNQQWVDSVFNTLSLDQKIGQLLMPRGHNSGQGYEQSKVINWIKKYHIGGVVMFAGQPTTQARLINELQEITKVPLLVGQDFEWGLAMRLDSTVRFPYQMGLGAMDGGTELLYEMGVEVGKQCKTLGVHVNYAPVVDVNNNPNNPVINFRSFGENKHNVTRKALAYMKGMQSQNLLVSAKHFPGHGDTGVDSHYDLPVIEHDKARLNDIELYPYKELIKNGLSGVMTAHLSIPALDDTPNLASTMSYNIITDLLRKELGFQGLTFTDAMDMQGAVKYYPDGQALVMALIAGNDILETFEDVPKAVEAIKKAIESGDLPLEVINARVKKILKAKSWVGLDTYKPAKPESLINDLNTYESKVLNRKISEKMITVISDEKDLLPLKDLTEQIAFISVGEGDATYFQKMSQLYTKTTSYHVPSNATDLTIQKVHNATHNYDKVVIGLHLNSIRPSTNYGIDDKTQFALDALLEHDNTVLVIFGNAYSLGKLKYLERAGAIVLAYQGTKDLQEAAAQAVFGAIPSTGKLPVKVNEKYPLGTGIVKESIGRLSYGFPEQEGVSGSLLTARVDSIVNLGLTEKAYPGSVVQIAKNGRVIYRKAFGFHTYEQASNAQKEIHQNQPVYEKGIKSDVMDNKNPFEPENAVKEIRDVAGMEYQPRGLVKLTDLYDLASVTKISTAALAVMQMMSEGIFDLDENFGTYYPAVNGTNKENLKFRDMLTHRSGLKAWIPFWMDFVDSTATINKALLAEPQLLEKFIFKPQPRRGFFQRLFTKKPIPVIDTMGTLEKDVALKKQVFTPQSLQWKPGIFANRPSELYAVEIADTLWMNIAYMDSIYKQIAYSPVDPGQGYVYSDLHYYTYPRFVPQLVGTGWETYLYSTYKKLGAHSLTYTPRKSHELKDIVPTERDVYFRKTQIHGRVHDEGAGMLNGISGHAGLFGNANDLMKLTQMYLQKGYYGGERFIKKGVLEECTGYQYDPKINRRAIAFDKLHPNKNIANGPQLASPFSYGHSGYTGTFTWIDPAYDMTYVFLSNRVYPTRENNKISELNIRTEVGNQIIKTLKGE